MRINFVRRLASTMAAVPGTSPKDDFLRRHLARLTELSDTSQTSWWSINEVNMYYH